MGCGMTKPTVPQPEPGTEGTDNHHAPVDEVTAAGEGRNELAVADEKVKQPDSPRSASPKSTDSGEKSTTVTDSDANEAQDYPICITTKTENDTASPLNPTATEAKKGFVAFDIPLDESQETMLENVFKKPLPKRLRHLEPLGHAPQITTEMLMEKLEKAEEKRQKALARWKEQAARRREMAQRRSEQLGDFHLTNSGSSCQQLNESDSPRCKPTECPMEEASTSKSKDAEQGNSTERGSAGSELAGILQLTNELDATPSPINIIDSSDHNNNSITPQRPIAEPQLIPVHTDRFSPDNSWSNPSVVSHYRSERRSYLQVLQEERESITSEEDFNTESPDQIEKPGTKNFQSVRIDNRNQVNNNNTREPLSFKCQVKLNRRRGT